MLTILIINRTDEVPTAKELRPNRAQIVEFNANFGDGGFVVDRIFTDSVVNIAAAVDAHGEQLDRMGAQMDRLTYYLRHKRASKFEWMMLVMILLVNMSHVICFM